MKPNRFLQIVQDEAGLRNGEEAKLATRIVFDLLHHRIAEEEAEDVESQLPRELALIWEGGPSWFQRLLSRFTPHNRFNRSEFIREVNARKQNLQATGEEITRAVFYALQNQISPGEAKDVARQLPIDLRALWEESSPLAPYTGDGGEMLEESPWYGRKPKPS